MYEKDIDTGKLNFYKPQFTIVYSLYNLLMVKKVN